jgi:4,4'-diaponeurosporenoate glycosyltransferase
MLSPIIVSALGCVVIVYMLFHLKPVKIKSKKKLSRVSIIIPARNEAHRIKPTLESLMPYLDTHEILIVDDHSTDETASLCKSKGFKVVHPLSKPDHIKGKPWALSQGVLNATCETIIFLDADVIVHEGGIEKLISLYEEKKHPISIQPYHLMKKSYERLANIFNILVVMSSSSYTMIPSKTISAFFGPCQIMSKQTFLEFGLNESVTRQVLEDIYLGKALLSGGNQISSYIGKGIVSFRMYPEGINDMLGGFSKNFATGAIAIGVIPSILLIIWLSSLYATLNLMIQSIIFMEYLELAITLYLTQGLLLYYFSKKIGNFRLSLIVLYPIHAIFFLLTFIWSFIKIYVIKKNTWKGRSV